MKIGIYVLTLFDGTICINQNYFVVEFEKNNNSLHNINIYIILFQELAHSIIKLLSAKGSFLNNKHNNDKNNNNHNNMAVILNNNNKIDINTEDDDLVYEGLALPKEFIDKKIVNNKKISCVADFNLRKDSIFCGPKKF